MKDKGNWCGSEASLGGIVQRTGRVTTHLQTREFVYSQAIESLVGDKQNCGGETFVLRLSLDDVVSGSFGAVSGVRSVNEIFFDASETPERRRKRR
ncbi:Hypothetical protein SMAX5B_008511 [Scophthalmus maximus]|uniref:Uncharacterized protein n=1 Tax=Scophthalmus maximus TaxID=52904 RepID=A0A2U9CDA5_SCOMX|nr:Hypothetical protein SMAX5B_008511 [Scophthalmus maximus]